MGKVTTSFEYTRNWFNFCFENPNKANSTDTALYLWLVELKNRMGWSEQFGNPARQAMQAIGVISYNTYKKSFDKLVDLGFVKVIFQSTNQYQATIIALSNIDKAPAKALDTSLVNHLQKHLIPQVDSTCKSTCDIDKPQTTNHKPQTNTIAPNVAEFKIFWELYGKKEDKSKCEAKFLKLKPQDVEKILQSVPEYVRSKPDIKFRKNPLTWLNGRCWEDEIVQPKFYATQNTGFNKEHIDNRD